MRRGSLQGSSYLILALLAAIALTGDLLLHAEQVSREQAARWQHAAERFDRTLKAVRQHLGLLATAIALPPPSGPVRRPSVQDTAGKLGFIVGRKADVLEGADGSPGEILHLRRLAPLFTAALKDLPPVRRIRYASRSGLVALLPGSETPSASAPSPSFEDLPTTGLHWSRPWKTPQGGEVMWITASQTVMRNGEPLGVLSLDLDLSTLLREATREIPLLHAVHLTDDTGRRLVSTVPGERNRSKHPATASTGTLLDALQVHALPLKQVPWRLEFLQTRSDFWKQVIDRMRDELLALTLALLLIVLLMRYRHARGHLRKVENRFRETVDLLPEIVYEADTEGNVTFLNQVGLQRLGYSTADLGQINLRDVFALPDPRAPHCLHGGSPEIEYQVRTRNGEQFPALLRAAPIREEGRITGERGILIDISELRRYQQELEARATTDHLTGCLNRRMFMELAEREFKRCRRKHHACSLLLMDLDHFKRINDTWGHRAGDETLCHFTRLLRQVLRETDLLGRIGGEEFAVLLPDAALEQAEEIAERVREHVARHPLEFGRVAIALTVSIGIAEIGPEGLDIALSQADHALYSAKDAGRNRVVSWI